LRSRSQMTYNLEQSVEAVWATCIVATLFESYTHTISILYLPPLFPFLYRESSHVLASSAPLSWSRALIQAQRFCPISVPFCFTRTGRSSGMEASTWIVGLRNLTYGGIWGGETARLFQHWILKIQFTTQSEINTPKLDYKKVKHDEMVLFLRQEKY